MANSTISINPINNLYRISSPSISCIRGGGTIDLNDSYFYYFFIDNQVLLFYNICIRCQGFTRSSSNPGFRLTMPNLLYSYGCWSNTGGTVTTGGQIRPERVIIAFERNSNNFDVYSSESLINVQNGYYQLGTNGSTLLTL